MRARLPDVIVGYWRRPGWEVGIMLWAACLMFFARAAAGQATVVSAGLKNQFGIKIAALDAQNIDGSSRGLLAIADWSAGMDHRPLPSVFLIGGEDWRTLARLSAPEAVSDPSIRRVIPRACTCIQSDCCLLLGWPAIPVHEEAVGIVEFVRIALVQDQLAVVRTAITESESTFGESLQCVGDIDGDGVSDALVGAPGYWSRGRHCPGRVYCVSSAARVPQWCIENDEPMEWGLGTAMQSVGDINGDGCADVVVAAASGSLVALSGKRGETLWAVRIALYGEVCQVALAAVGDLDGGGVIDVAFAVLPATGGFDEDRRTGRVGIVGGEKGCLIWEVEALGGDAAGYGVSLAAVGGAGRVRSRDLLIGSSHAKDLLILDGGSGAIVGRVVAPASFDFGIELCEDIVDADGDGYRDFLVSDVNPRTGAGRGIVRRYGGRLINGVVLQEWGATPPAGATGH